MRLVLTLALGYLLSGCLGQLAVPSTEVHVICVVGDALYEGCNGADNNVMIEFSSSGFECRPHQPNDIGACVSGEKCWVQFPAGPPAPALVGVCK